MEVYQFIPRSSLVATQVLYNLAAEVARQAQAVDLAVA